METLTIAEGLRELGRIDKLLRKRYRNIKRYASKLKATVDEIPNQQAYIREQEQSARDLLVRWKTIKLAINTANLEATFTFNDTEYSVAEAILHKQYLSDQYAKLYDSFDTTNADNQLSAMSIRGLNDESRQAMNLVPEVYFNIKIVQKNVENLLALTSRLDALIDASNHRTTIAF